MTSVYMFSHSSYQAVCPDDGMELELLFLLEQEAGHVLACLSKQASGRTSDVCIECGIYTTSAVSFDDHECGAKHAAQLKLLAGEHSQKHKRSKPFLRYIAAVAAVHSAACGTAAASCAAAYTHCLHMASIWVRTSAVQL